MVDDNSEKSFSFVDQNQMNIVWLMMMETLTNICWLTKSEKTKEADQEHSSDYGFTCGGTRSALCTLVGNVCLFVTLKHISTAYCTTNANALHCDVAKNTILLNATFWETNQ